MASVIRALMSAAMVFGVLSAGNEDDTLTSFKTSVNVTITSCTPLYSDAAATAAAAGGGGGVCVSERTPLMNATSLATACPFLAEYTNCMNRSCTSNSNLESALQQLNNTCGGMNSVETTQKPTTTTSGMNSVITTENPTTTKKNSDTSTESLVNALLTLISLGASLVFILE